MNQNQNTTIVIKDNNRPGDRLGRGPFIGAMLAALVAGSAAAAQTNLTWGADATVKETYDDNVYLEDVKPTVANLNAAQSAGLNPVQAYKGSFVTTVQPRFGLNYQPCSGFDAALGYAPEINLYDSAEDEDYIAHRATLNFDGSIKDATWEFLNSPTFIEGSTIGPTFARPEDVPAIGGIPLRDRREQFVYRDAFHLTVPLGNWFIRPVATAYYLNFLTHQRLNPSATSSKYYYENYIDRQDVNGGVDAGYNVGRKTFVVLGYRYGRQDQGMGPNSASTAFVKSPYDSFYQRILAGVEGSPAKWLKLNVQLGPEFRRFDAGVPVDFGRNEVLCYADASATVLPTTADTISIHWTRFEQPAFSSESVYEDIKYDLSWRHKFCDQFTAGAGFTLYAGDWQAPVNRNDWIYTPSVSASYAFTKHLSAEAAGSYDYVKNQVPTSAPGAEYADGREFRRALVSLALKYVF